ncbi:MAG: hypothetical protein P8L85_05160 [Rubripirellula sp.]|nr:hypothetical protein [Rubripirellula sp.]
MRNLLIFGMLLIAASAAGWFRVNRQGDRTLIEINQNEIRNDARNVINRGREYLHRGEQLATQEFGQSPQQTQSYQQPQSYQQTQTNQQTQWGGEQLASEPQAWQYDSHWQPQAPANQPPQQQPVGNRWQQPYSAQQQQQQQQQQQPYSTPTQQQPGSQTPYAPF